MVEYWNYGTFFVVVTSCLTLVATEGTMEGNNTSGRSAHSLHLKYGHSEETFEPAPDDDSHQRSLNLKQHILGNKLAMFSSSTQEQLDDNQKTDKDLSLAAKDFLPDATNDVRLLPKPKHFNEFVSKRETSDAAPSIYQTDEDYVNQLILQDLVHAFLREHEVVTNRYKRSYDFVGNNRNDLIEKRYDFVGKRYDFLGKRNLYDFIRKRYDFLDKRSYDFLGKRSPYEFVGKRSPYEFVGKRSPYEFVGKRSPYEFVGKRYEFVGKRSPYEFVGKRSPYEFVGKRYEFVGKRSPYEFVGKRSPYEFVGKRSPYEFVGKRSPYEFVGKRSPYEFVGKRSPYEFVGKRSPYEFVGKRYEFVGKRSPYEFVGKRSPYEFVGKRNNYDDVSGDSLTTNLSTQADKSLTAPPDRIMTSLAISKALDIEEASKRYTEFIGKRGRPQEQDEAALNRHLAVLLRDNELSKRLSGKVTDQYPEFIGK